jgi:hypothetical protein
MRDTGGKDSAVQLEKERIEGNRQQTKRKSVDVLALFLVDTVILCRDC